MDIKGVSALVTGGASGLGAATALYLAQAGAKVTVCDVDDARVQAVATQMKGLGVVCDVTHENQVQNALQAARNAHGPVRVVVNCAGIAPGARIVGREGPHALDLFNKIIEVNLVGTFNVLRLAAADIASLSPLSKDEERGVIINTASVAAYEGQIGQAAYAAAKAGVVGLTLPAARELARFGIRVVTIAPGLFETPMLGGMSPEVQHSLQSATVFPRRLGLPDEYARLVLHIVENSMLNGDTIRLDGAVRLAAK